MQLSSCVGVLYSDFALKLLSESSGPYAIFAFRALQTLILLRSSFPGSWCNVVFSLSLKPVFPAPCDFCTAACPSYDDGQLLASSTNFLGPDFSQEVPFSSCHSCIAGHLPAGGSQLLPRSTISSGQFLWLSISPCS
jgi:hypothetical protein